MILSIHSRTYIIRQKAGIHAAMSIFHSKIPFKCALNVKKMSAYVNISFFIQNGSSISSESDCGGAGSAVSSRSFLMMVSSLSRILK